MPTDYSQYWQNLTPQFDTSHNPTYEDVQNAFNWYLGHGATDVSPWARDPNYQQHIWESPEALQYRATHMPQGMQDPNAPPAAAAAGGGGASTSDTDAWLTSKLQQYGVDMSELPYWQGIVRQYGGSIDAVGADWLEDRIHRADSSADVRSGAISRVQHGGGQSGMPALPNVPEFTYDPWTKKFEAPTDVTEQNDPGYAFRRAEGQKALERGAAAQGVLLTGGTEKALSRYNQDYASNEYQRVYDRAMGEYQTAYGEYLNNYQQALQKFGTNYGVTSDQYNRAMGQYGQRYLENQQAYQNQQGEQNNYWNRMMQLYSGGLGAAGGANQSGDAYATNAGNYLSQIGNAYAGGQVGSANAYNSLYGNVSNMLQAGAMGAFNRGNQYWGANPWGSGTVYGRPR